MGIVNAGQLAIYEEIPKDLRERVEDVILGAPRRTPPSGCSRSPNATRAASGEARR